MIQSNRYYIDGADMWETYRVGVESGSDDFLKMPRRKESISHDWKDENGLDVDLTRVFLEAKTIELKCHILAESEAQFWLYYEAFLYKLTRPGLRRITVTELGKDFYVYYDDCTIYQRFTRIRGSNLVACKFNLKLIEKLPTSGTAPTFLVSQNDLFIIT